MNIFGLCDWNKFENVLEILEFVLKLSGLRNIVMVVHSAVLFATLIDEGHMNT